MTVEDPIATRSQLRLEIGQSLAQLRAHAEQWDKLALVQPQRIPFLTYGWASAHIEYLLSPNSRWLCLFAYDEDQLVGVLPVEIVQQKIFGISATVVQGLRHSHSYSFDFITVVDRADAVRTFLFESVKTAVPDWTLLRLNRIPEQSPTIAFAQKPDGGKKVIIKDDGVGAYQPTVGSYDDYLKTLSGNFSSNLRRRKKKLDSLLDVRFEVIDYPADTERLLKQFIQVESAGWKGKERSAVGSGEHLIKFYTQMAHNMTGIGSLEWHFIYQGDKAIAGHCAARIGDVISVMKMGYDESFSDYAPGNMLIDQLNRRCFADGGISAINWLSDMAWHRNWQMPHWKYYSIAFYGSNVFGQFLYRVETFKRFLAKVPMLQRFKRKLIGPKG
jgi:CelD/BcsL family acetyltransferase involved in cellulose biosynthesis